MFNNNNNISRIKFEKDSVLRNLTSVQKLNFMNRLVDNKLFKD